MSFTFRINYRFFDSIDSFYLYSFAMRSFVFYQYRSYPHVTWFMLIISRARFCCSKLIKITFVLENWGCFHEIFHPWHCPHIHNEFLHLSGWRYSKRLKDLWFIAVSTIFLYQLKQNRSEASQTRRAITESCVICIDSRSIRVNRICTCVRWYTLLSRRLSLLKSYLIKRTRGQKFTLFGIMSSSCQ